MTITSFWESSVVVSMNDVGLHGVRLIIDVRVKRNPFG